jgi:hypothetical protein
MSILNQQTILFNNYDHLREVKVEDLRTHVNRLLYEQGQHGKAEHEGRVSFDVTDCHAKPWRELETLVVD